MVVRIPYRVSKVNVVVHSKGNVLYYISMLLLIDNGNSDTSNMENVL